MILCIALKLSSSRWTSGLVERKQASSSRLLLFIKLVARCSSFHRVGDQVFRQETNDLNLTHSSPYLWNLQVKKRSQVMLDSINWYLSWLKVSLCWGACGSAEKTRLTYNCAHLRSTKESLTIEYFEKKLIFWVKIFLGENFWDENFFWVKTFWVIFFL